MILSIGEILVDLIGSNDNGVTCYKAFAGGAPYNVACGIAKLGGKSSFLGKVGNDLQGDFLYRHSLNQRFVRNLIVKDDDFNTTLAFVKLDENGERDFCFHRKNTADYQLNLDEYDSDIIDDYKIIHVGSLMLSEEKGRLFARNIFDLAHKKNKIVSFDVNFRDDIYKDSNTAVEIYREFIDKADIIKFSKEELEMFSFGEKLEDKLRNLAKKDQLICVTLGATGSAYYFNGAFNIIESVKVKPIDTTGAGDAFFAGVLKQLDENEKLDEITLDKIFKYANVCGALTTLGYGAIDAFPNEESIKEALK